MSLIDVMRAGDRDAYRAVLAEHGSGLQSALRSWSDALPNESLFVFLWQASMVAPDGIDERAYVAATAVGWMVAQTEAAYSDLPYAHADLVDFGKAVARKVAGIPREGDELSLNEAAEPGASKLQSRVTEATQAILQTRGPWQWAETHWDDLVQKLR